MTEALPSPVATGEHPVVVISAKREQAFNFRRVESTGSFRVRKTTLIATGDGYAPVKGW